MDAIRYEQRVGGKYVCYLDNGSPNARGYYDTEKEAVAFCDGWDAGRDFVLAQLRPIVDNLQQINNH